MFPGYFTSPFPDIALHHLLIKFRMKLHSPGLGSESEDVVGIKIVSTKNAGISW